MNVNNSKLHKMMMGSQCLEHLEQSPTREEREGTQHRVVKLPPIWKENADVWFFHTEAAFEHFGIRDDASKFVNIVSNLDQTVRPFVADLLISPPTENKYETLKTRIIASFDEIEKSKLRIMLRHSTFTNEIPSKFLLLLRQLIPPEYREDKLDVIKAVFFEYLPDYVRAILERSSATDIFDLASQADNIVKAWQSDIDSIARPMENSVKSYDINEKLLDLEKMVKSTVRKNREFRMRVSRNRSLSWQRSETRERKATLCFYHAKFGEEAQKCSQPCCWI